MWKDVAAVVGAISLTCTLLRVLRFLQVRCFASPNLRKKYANAGDWAVVTGASEGIGYAMSMELAGRGFNVCVIARRQSKLDAVVREIEQFGVKGLAISFDFSTATFRDYRSLFRSLDELQIAVLVNNVGVNYEYTNYFDEVDVDLDANLIRVNTESSVRMTKYVVGHMKEARAGAIVLLGSFSAVTPTPLLATYAGTKAFNVSFGASLHYELKEFGIDVLAVTPNLVVSKMTQGRSSRPPRESFLVVNARSMARQTLNQLGKVAVTSGHFNHAVIEALVKLVPTGIFASKVLKMHKSVKRRAERKQS